MTYWREDEGIWVLNSILYVGELVQGPGRGARVPVHLFGELGKVDIRVLAELVPLSCSIGALTIEELLIDFHVPIVVNIVGVVPELLHPFWIGLRIELSLAWLAVAVDVYDASILNGLVVACSHLLVRDLAFVLLAIDGVQE